jgi:uncharacterized protein (TIGR02246 family)
MDDQRGIENLIGRYCDAVLRADAATWASCWTADACWVIPGTGEVVGRDAIAATFAEIRGLYDLCVQEVLNSTVEIDGDRAHARWQVRETQHRADGSGSELLGVYHDDLRRESDAWQFERREFELVYRGERAMPGRVYRRPERAESGSDTVRP